jgi:rubrerythrin
VSTPINPVFPIGELATVEALMDVAVGMEEEAALRYEQLAAEMGRVGEPLLAGLFTELAELERGHARGLAGWARREGRPSPHAVHFPWRLPETFGGGDESDGSPLTPYNALGIAVRNEERAFAFYTYVAAQADRSEPVRTRAEALAREELEHVAQLRRLRRREYHRNRAVARPNRPEITSMAELHTLAWGLEHGAAVVEILAADGFGQAGAAALLLRRAAEQSQTRARRLADLVAGGADLVARGADLVARGADLVARGDARVPPPGSEVVEAARTAGIILPGAMTPAGLLNLCLRDAEQILDLYLGIAERAVDETLMLEAQDLAEAAVARLALIHSLVADT